MDELWIILDAQIDLLLPRQPPASSASQLNSPLIDFGTVNKLCQCIRTKYRDSIYDHPTSKSYSACAHEHAPAFWRDFAVVSSSSSTVVSSPT